MRKQAGLPERAPVVVVGAGFAGVGTAWALGRRGRAAGGVILEQEETYGYHASGRNAAILRLVEADPVLRALAARSIAHITALDTDPRAPLLGIRGGLTLGSDALRDDLEEEYETTSRQEGLPTELLTAAGARSRFPLLEAVRFDAAVWCPTEAVVDIHALLTLYLQQARETGFTFHPRCRVEGLLVEAGRVTGVETNKGRVRADVVVDASGAWSGRWGGAALPLQPLRRHLFVSGPPPGGHRNSPFAWVEDAGFYFRPEGDGLLLSACDETPMSACDPPIDPAAADLLAEKMSRHAATFIDLPIRRSWACLRTFAPDRRPFIGPDPELPGLFHVCGLGGCGMGTSAAVGELAATLIAGETPDWFDPALLSPGR